MKTPIIVLGGGGHARVLLDILNLRSERIVGIVDPGLPVGGNVMGIPVIGDDDVVGEYAVTTIRLVNGLGSTGTSSRRRQIFAYFSDLGYEFASVIHPSVVVAKGVSMGGGVQLMAGCLIQTGAVLRDNVLINTGASVDHDSFVGNHVHIAPGATVCGDVKIADGAFIGSGATIIHGLNIGCDALVGAGSVVVRDVDQCDTVIGVPARVIQQ